MTTVKAGAPSPSLRLYHLAIWMLCLLLSFRYFTIATPGIFAWVQAMVTTFFALLSFYAARLFLVPVITGARKKTGFFVSAILFVAGISLCRTVLELVIFRLFLDTKQWHFMSMFWTSALLTSFVLLLGIAMGLNERNYREKEKMNALLTEKLATELSYLKSQLHPHFLFNLHNTIFFLINENPALASEMLLKLSGIMRYHLYECEAATVPLDGELDNIRNYLDLEKVRLGSKVDIKIHLQDDLQGFRIAPFMLMPIAENAVKHISHFKSGPNYIHVLAEADKAILHFRVVNTCESSDDASRKKEFAAGIGLLNLKRRLNLIYGDNYQMRISRMDNLFTTNLELHNL
jgi:two-component system LytT family sensor kinase